MVSERRSPCPRAAVAVGLVAMALAVHPAAAAAPADAAGSALLLDFQDDVQFTRLRVGPHTRVEPAPAASGRRAARLVFSAVPESARAFPVVIAENECLRVRDFRPFEALSLRVMNPGPDDADLSLAIWDADGRRSFPVPSTVTIPPGRWQQVVVRLVLHGLDPGRIGSLHFFQKSNRRPVTLLIDEVRLLSPSAGRVIARIQTARTDLARARAGAAALGVRDKVEPAIAAVSQRLDQLADPTGPGDSAAQKLHRLADLARAAAAAQDLAGAIVVRNEGKDVRLIGPHVEPGWLSDPDKMSRVVALRLFDTPLADDAFSHLAPARALETLLVNGRRVTGSGLAKLPGTNLRRLGLPRSGARDDALSSLRAFRQLRDLELNESDVTSGVLRHLDGLDQLKSLNLSGTGVSDAGFERVAELVNLESLDLDRTRITGASLRHLAPLTHLKELDLRDTKIDDAGLPSLATLTGLESLLLEDTPITGAGFRGLGSLTNLKTLNLNRTRVGDAALRNLGKVAKLKRLELSSTRITDASLQQVASARLEYLDLYGTNITHAGLAHLRNQRDLTNLYLAGTATSDAGIAHLASLTNLEQLDLTGTRITDAGLEHLRGMTKLASLKLGKTIVTGAGLSHLAGLAKLRVLDLSGTGVGDAGLEAVGRLEGLRTLDLGGTRVTSQGVGQLRGARQLTELSLEATQVGDPGIGFLAALPNLQRLNLNETPVTSAGLKDLRRLEKLRSLSLNRTRIADDGLAELGDRYTTLELAHTRVTDSGIEYLRGNDQLAQLNLAATGITDNALRLLQATPGLRQLDLAGTNVTDTGLEYLGLLPELRQLKLDGTPASDLGTDTLIALPGLQRVSLENSRVTAAGASYLKYRAPQLELGLVFPWTWGARWSSYQPADVAALPARLRDTAGLRSLHVSGAQLTPEFLRSLKDLPGLEHLSFHGSSLTDEMLADLLGLSQVARLDLSGTRVTDEGLSHLKDMQNLRELNLDGTRVTGSGFVHFAGLNRLRALGLRNTPVHDGSLARLAVLDSLRHLELSDTRVTDLGVEHLLKLPKLQFLDLYGTGLTDTGVARLARLTSLRYCYLSRTRVTDAGVAHLRRLNGLEELGLDGTELTDRGLESVRSLTNLRRLRIGGTRVTDAGLATVAGLPNLARLEADHLAISDAGVATLRSLPRLAALDLSGARISDGALTSLAGLPNLTELNVRDTPVSPHALEQFRREHPGVAVTSGATQTGYSAWAIGIMVLYGIVVVAICFYGAHRYWLVWQFVRDKAARTTPEPKGCFTELPAVTVQLAMFNERQVAERIIEAACALDYPRDRLQIQVLDDSTDDSADVARRCCERMAALGHRVEYRHRSARRGFKGGALAEGLATASGEFVAVFDADFVPPPDFLRKTIHHFTDPSAGMVQAEWSHLNRRESLLTEIQAMFLDGHFVVEQTMRSRNGRWFNFNGTAGVWRRRCIDDAGGWHHDTLTEDTDLSYRAQLKGWRFVYLPGVRCDAELPATMTAFLGQQHRWTKGLIQNSRKLLPRILASRAPWRVKLEAWYHLTAPVMYLVMLVLTGIALPAMFLATPLTDGNMLAFTLGIGTLGLGTFAAATFYVASQRAQGFGLLRTLLKLPILMALGIGMCVVNGRAVLEGLLGIRSPFVRTPKFGGRADCDPDPSVARRRWRIPAGLAELSIAGVLYACLVLSLLRPFTLIGAPFLLLFALGYTGVGMLSLLDRYGGKRGEGAARFRPAFGRLAIGTVATVFLVCVAATTFAIAIPPETWSTKSAPDLVRVGIDLTAGQWRIAPAAGKDTAVKRLDADRGSLVLAVQLDEQTDQGEIILDLSEALSPLGDSMRSPRRLSFDIEYPPRFTGEAQAFAQDAQRRREYGSMEVVESHDGRRALTVSLIPDRRLPAMGYQDEGFDPGSGIRLIGLKISAQSDRVRGAGYRSFRGTIRISNVRVTDVDSSFHAEPEVRPPDEQKQRRLSPAAPSDFVAASGVDRPWPIGYGFSGPVTPAHVNELDRTYAAIARLGCRFTRVYVGDYRTGLTFDGNGRVTGVESEFLTYLDRLAEVANRHGVTVMFSLTDNTLADGRGIDAPEWIRAGEPSNAFVNNVLVRLIERLKGRSVIWDVFNEPENVTALPLRTVQEYVDRALAAGKRADPNARFTVVSRSRPEIEYWQGRGLDVYTHNLFTDRGLHEALAAPRVLDAPIMVAEMAPELASEENLNALREAGYSGVGIWGWGTGDKYRWEAADLERVVAPLVRGSVKRNEER